MAKSTAKTCAVPASVAARPLLSRVEAGGLAAVFKVLANDTRLRLLHALIRSEELCVTDLATHLRMRPQAISNQLQRLSDLGVVTARRDGNNVYYRLVDVCIRGLLEQGWCLMDEVANKATKPRRPGASR